MLTAKADLPSPHARHVARRCEAAIGLAFSA